MKQLCQSIFRSPLEKSTLRHIWTCSLATTLAVTLIACGNNDDSVSQQADLIFENGSVYTVDTTHSQAEAVAVKDGKIVYVGNNSGLKDWRGKETQVIDLKGKMLLPGFKENLQVSSENLAHRIW